MGPAVQQQSADSDGIGEGELLAWSKFQFSRHSEDSAMQEAFKEKNDAKDYSLAVANETTKIRGVGT
jgi:hypothetical protein